MGTGLSQIPQRPHAVDPHPRWLPRALPQGLLLGSTDPQLYDKECSELANCQKESWDKTRSSFHAWEKVLEIARPDLLLLPHTAEGRELLIVMERALEGTREH